QAIFTSPGWALRKEAAETLSVRKASERCDMTCRKPSLWDLFAVSLALGNIALLASWSTEPISVEMVLSALFRQATVSQVESPGMTAERPTASQGLAKSTAKERFEVMAICARTTSNLPDCSPGISPSQSLSMNWTSTPRSLPSLRANSIQKPLISPV